MSAAEPIKLLPSKMSFAEAVDHRRSVYTLTPDISPVTDSQVVQLVRETVLHVPSSFNSQSARVVLVLGEEHKKFWNMVLEEHIKAAGDDTGKIERTKPRVEGFMGAYGTAIFLESNGVVRGMQEKFAAYASLFPEWSEHASGMHQFVLWTALEAHGLGANLQHFQFVPSVETRAKEMYGYPDDWQMKAQLVFGGVKEGTYPTEPKPKTETSETVRVFGAKD